jgi:glycogen synthase
MKIALVTPEFVTEENYDGGLANYIYRLALSLVALGNEPIVFTASNRSDDFILNNFRVIRVNTTLGRLEFLRSYSFGRKIFWLFHYLYQSWRLNRSLAKYCASNQIDLVQYSHLEAVGLFRLSQIPSIVRLSSYTPMIFAGQRLKGGRQQTFWEKKAMVRADGLFGPSRMVAQLVQKEIGKNVVVIPSPFVMDPQELDETIYQKHLFGKKYLLYFGTISVLKGLETIAEVLKPLFSSQANLYFVVVGKDHPLPDGTSLVDKLFESAGEYNQRLLRFDKLKHDQLYPIIQNAIAVVLPSRVDNFPNTCIEAMACCRVVIGTRGTSFEELIDHGKNGVLCAIDDPKELLLAIRSVLEMTDDQRNSMGIAAFERINKLRPEIVVNDLLIYYRAIISSCNK